MAHYVRLHILINDNFISVPVQLNLVVSNLLWDIRI